MVIILCPVVSPLVFTDERKNKKQIVSSTQGNFTLIAQQKGCMRHKAQLISFGSDSNTVVL